MNDEDALAREPELALDRALDRRTLFTRSAAGAAVAVAASLLERRAHAEPQPPKNATPAAGTFDLEEATIAELQERMTSGRETARSLVEKYSARIDALDRKGPQLRSVLELNPEAAAIAATLDAERKAGKLRGPLHGIPILLKDNLATADRMTTTAGSLALEGFIAPSDSFVAKKLREAGAILLGKANLSEWANIRSSNSSSGWSGRGGQCRNPYALDRQTSGSSSGSGAAVAANLCAAAIGSETDGSIVSPSNNCSLVGVKPTVGLVSRTGIIPISHSQDTAGPMTRTVRDAAIILGAIAGIDPADPATAAKSPLGARKDADYLAALDANGLKGARIGVPRETLYGQSPAADRLVEAALAEMKRLGAELIDPVSLPKPSDLNPHELNVLLAELKADLNAWFQAFASTAKVHSLKDVIEFNERNRDRELHYFGQDLFEKAEKTNGLADKAYRSALQKIQKLARKDGIDATMNKHKLDALVAPTSQPPTLIDLVNGDYGVGGSSSFPAVAGYPHITVPAGYYLGLPVGISFFGRAYSEATLFRIAYAFEQATKHRKPPRLLAGAEL